MAFIPMPTVRMIVRLHECVSGFLEVFPYIPPPLFSFPLSHLVK